MGPARFPAELSQTTFIREAVVDDFERDGSAPFFIHASFIRPHPPRRNPLGYHDLYLAEAVGPFVGSPTREEEAGIHPLGAGAMRMPGVGAPEDEQERRQFRATYSARSAKSMTGWPSCSGASTAAAWPSRPWSS